MHNYAKPFLSYHGRYAVSFELNAWRCAGIAIRCSSIRFVSSDLFLSFFFLLVTRSSACKLRACRTHILTTRAQRMTRTKSECDKMMSFLAAAARFSTGWCQRTEIYTHEWHRSSSEWCVWIVTIEVGLCSVCDLVSKCFHIFSGYHCWYCCRHHAH